MNLDCILLFPSAERSCIPTQRPSILASNMASWYVNAQVSQVSCVMWNVAFLRSKFCPSIRFWLEKSL